MVTLGSGLGIINDMNQCIMDYCTVDRESWNSDTPRSGGWKRDARLFNFRKRIYLCGVARLCFICLLYTSPSPRD